MPGMLRTMAALAAVLTIAGCAAPPPAPGSAREAVLRDWGAPTSRYRLADGAERLEYASGPFGVTTWMVDIDAGGRVLRSRQVLSEAELMHVQQRAAGALHRDELLRWIGRPSERRRGGRSGGEVWSWRYPTYDCLWFQVSVADDGKVMGGAFAVDPLCDIDDE